MVSFTLDDLQPLLDAFPAPALLFQDDTLLQLNLAALRLQLPLKAGMSAGELFPAETLSAFRFDGPGSRMLTEDFLGQQRELCDTHGTASVWSRFLSSPTPHLRLFPPWLRVFWPR